MARLNVNSTRMERSNQKIRLKTARRGHKLLKDKSDEMLRHFLRLVKQNQNLRTHVEEELVRALRLFMTARAHMATQEIENAVESCSLECSFTPSKQNIMGLTVPKVALKDAAASALIRNDVNGASSEVAISKQSTNSSSIFLTTHPSFDKSIHILSALMTKLIELANVEKSCAMLADEIQRIRRRVNALEYSVIPQISETIRYITMKLAENERGNQVRLMKVKEILQNAED